jgi:SAM-dependent methyltransferase
MRRLAYHETMGILGVGDLHPGGLVATQFLLAELDRKNPRDVLEIGAGIGLTTARLIERGWHVVSIEPNEVLRQVLESRLHRRICSDTFESFSGADASYDAVIVEGALYRMDLAAAFAKVHRLLRPGGLLALVDMVWTEAADPKMVASIYDQTLTAFGIPMASRDRLTWYDWKRLLGDVGFSAIAERKVQSSDWRSQGRTRAAAAVAALRHPVATLQHLSYRFQRRPPSAPPGWLESWMSVWKRDGSPSATAGTS